MKYKLGNSGNPNCPFEVRWNLCGKLHRKRFKFKGDAELYLRQMQGEDFLSNEFRFLPAESVVFKEIKDFCQNKGISLSDVCGILAKYVKDPKDCGKDYSAAVAEFIEDLTRRGARDATVKYYSAILRLFQTREDIKNIAEYSQDAAEKYLASINSPAHSKRSLGSFFAFCVSKKWISVNPFAGAKIPRVLKEVAAPSILTVAETIDFLAKIPTEWQPTAAILAFAGVRPIEILPLNGAAVLKIQNIDFDARKITIPAEVSKVRRVRILENLPENIWQWLEPLKARGGAENVAAGSYEIWRRVKSATAIALPKDVFRHSFASYAYHYLGAEHTVEILGHVGGFGVFAKHYKGLATIADSRKYFSILPKE